MNLDSLLHPPTTRSWSPLQEAIFDYPREEPLIIQAVAGSGKTTTEVELMNRRGGDALFLAFNKAIASELASRVNGATVKTFNALGHQLMMRKRPGAKLDSWRVSKRIRQIMNAEDYKQWGSQCVRAISLAKSHANFQPSAGTYLELIDAYELDIPIDVAPQLARMCERVFYELEKNVDTFDFDDQLFIPIKEGWQFPIFDQTYVDEAQDLNPVQHLMLQRLADRGSILTAVGDRHQAIYGFRGASSESMDEMKHQFKMGELPLSITYRCCQSVTRLAQRFVPHIQFRDNAPEGSVNESADYPELQSYRPGDLIVCRNNAPIFDYALQFLKAGLPCRVLSNFLETLEGFIDQLDASTSRDFRTKLDIWFDKEKRACEDSGRYGRLAGIQDRYDTLRAFSDSYSTTADMVRAIRALATSTNGPRISTVHKAKGLEAASVFILRPDLLPSPRAQSPAQLQAEANLQYVAITRAQTSLTFLPREEQ